MSFVTTEIQDAVAVLTIDRPKALNALNPEVLADLKAAFEAIDQNTVRCVVLTGAGDKSFVAGADIGSMSTMTKAEGEAFGKLGNDVFLMIESFPLPVIAAVNGFALGGGNELAMSCDIRLCSDNAVFGQPEVGLGITPGFGGTQRLARLVGMGMAKQLVYSALNIKADVYELLDTGMGKCRMCVAGPAGFTDDESRALRVATKFVNIARDHYERRGRDIDIVKLNGSIELAPILGLSDVIVDIVETGTTLKENDLTVIEEFMPISARFIANKASYKFKYAQLTELLNKMKEALAK